MSEGKNKKKLHVRLWVQEAQVHLRFSWLFRSQRKNAKHPKANSFIARACFRPCFFLWGSCRGWWMALLREKNCAIFRTDRKLGVWVWGKQNSGYPDSLKGPSLYSLRDFHQKGTLWRNKNHKMLQSLNLFLRMILLQIGIPLEFITMADHLGEDFWNFFQASKKHSSHLVGLHVIKLIGHLWNRRLSRPPNQEYVGPDMCLQRFYDRFPQLVVMSYTEKINLSILKPLLKNEEEMEWVWKPVPF